MKRVTFALLLAASAICACSGREAGTISKDPSAQKTPLPAPLSSLGAPCTTETDDVHCGTDGRIALLVVHQPLRLPAGAKAGGTDTQPTLVAVEEGRVWVHWECVVCRVPSTDYAVADLSRVSDASLARLQAWAGLPASPALRTEADWRTATRDWKPAGS
jgi:hypothetical protein